MLTTRSFRNEDPPRLLELWRKSQQGSPESSPLFPISLNQLQAQILGSPMFDNRSISLAFDKDVPVGYIHTTPAPSADGNSLDPLIGHICFLCVDPAYGDPAAAAAALIQAGENYLAGLGAKTIFGGSPTPSAPFYTAYYGGGEALGILHFDKSVVNAFQQAQYKVHKNTVWFHLDLRNYTPTTPLETASYYSELSVEIHDVPDAKNWWDGCIRANGIWFDATVFWSKADRPIARLRTRISYPDTENFLAMYSGTWFASLIEIRVHPDFQGKGIQKYLLEEVLNYLGSQKQVVQVEAHAAEDSALYTLLHNRDWIERGTGSIFIKEL